MPIAPRAATASSICTKLFTYFPSPGTLNLFFLILGTICDASHPPAPNPHTKYSKVRLEAQNYAQSACSKDNSAFAVACMSDVYGAGGWLASQIVPRIKKNRFKVPGDGKYVKSFVHIDDAVAALGAIGMDSKEGIHILADSEPVMFSEFIRYICKLLDHKYPGNVPSMIAKMLMGQDAVKMLTTPTVCDGSAMAKMINVRYPSYKTGLVEAIGRIIS